MPYLKSTGGYKGFLKVTLAKALEGLGRILTGPVRLQARHELRQGLLEGHPMPCRRGSGGTPVEAARGEFL